MRHLAVSEGRVGAFRVMKGVNQKMIVKPKVRGFICTTAHPVGCEAAVKQQIDYVKAQPRTNGPKKVLVIGASMGYGLASRISAAYSCARSELSGTYWL